MSLDLALTKIRPIFTTELLFHTRLTLCDLLQVTSIPELTLEEIEEGIYYPFSSNLIGDKDGFFSVSVKSTDVKVFLIILPNKYTSIEVSYTRSPLELALAAAVAVILSKTSASTIIDEGLVWSSIYEQSSNNFADNVRVKHPFTNIHKAAESLYAAKNQCN